MNATMRWLAMASMAFVAAGLAADGPAGAAEDKAKTRITDATMTLEGDVTVTAGGTTMTVVGPAEAPGPEGEARPKHKVFVSGAARMGPLGPAPVGPVRKVKVTYLGVTTLEAGEALSRQLGLPEGVGLVVEYVAAESPAAKAGILRHDVLHKLDGQILVNTPQLAVLVRMHKPGQEVKLTVMRQGKATVVPVELGERDMHQVAMAGTMVLQAPRVGMDLPKPLGELLPEHCQPGIPGGLARDFRWPGAPSGIGFSDGEHNLKVIFTEWGWKLIAMDKSGKVVFSGPIESDEQRQKVPPEILEKLERLERSAFGGLVLPAGPGRFDALEQAVREARQAAERAFTEAAERAAREAQRAVDGAAEQARQALEKAARELYEAAERAARDKPQPQTAPGKVDPAKEKKPAPPAEL